MVGAERDQRLMLRVVAGGARLAIDATSVFEVAPPDEGGASLHGYVLLEDLSVRLGGPPEARPGTAVVLDTSPTLALRVREARGVADAASAPWYVAPRALSARGLVRGVVELQGELYFDLDPDALARADAPEPPVASLQLREAPAPLQAVTFRAAGGEWALPLHAVRQIVTLEKLAPCARQGALLGVVPWSGRVWPVWRLPGQEQVGPGALAVLFDAGGEAHGLVAERAPEVRQAGALGAARLLDPTTSFS